MWRFQEKTPHVIDTQEPRSLHSVGDDSVTATEELELTGTAKKRSWRTSGWTRVISPLLIVGLWQGGSVFGYLPTSTLDSPVSVGRTFWKLMANGQLEADMAVSLRRVVIGLAIGLTIGTFFALISGLFLVGERLVDPPMQMLRTVPVLALVPLLITWFGIYEIPKIVIIAVGSSIPIYLNVFAGIRGVDEKLIEAGKVLGLSRTAMIRHIMLPGALPQTLVGLRMSLGHAWLLLVIAETINASAGLGHLLDFGQQFLETDLIVLVIVIYGFLGIATDLMVRLLERLVLSWRTSFSGT